MTEVLLYELDQDELPHMALIMKLSQHTLSVASNQNELFYCANAFRLKPSSDQGVTGY